MAQYQIQAPDGNTYSVTGPEGATQAQVQAEVLKQNPQAGTAKAGEPSFVDHALSVLKGVASQNSPGATLEPLAHAASGMIAQPIAGLAGLGTMGLNAVGASHTNPADVVNKTQNALTYQSKGDQAKQTQGAMDSILGLPGQVANSAGEAVSDATGSPALGAAANTGLQGLAMLAGGKAVKALAPADLPTPAAPITPSLINQTLKDARASGAVVTPEYSASAGGTGGGATGTIASLAGSETKMQQTLSKYNARVWAPKVAAQEVGLTPEQLSPAGLDQAASKASGAYTAVQRVGDFTPDADLVDDLKKLGARKPDMPTPEAIQPDAAIGGASPGYQPMTAPSIIQAVRDLRADARALYKNVQDPESLRQAAATRGAADALDDFVQRQLRASTADGGKGLPNLADAYSAARVRLAKIVSVRDALNPATGSIDGSSLATDLDNGVPLSGGLKTIAMTAKAFPKVMQVPERLPASTGPTVLEQGGAVTALLHGNIPLALSMFARPIARARVGTNGFQNQMVNPRPPAPPVLPGPIAASPLAQPIVGQASGNGSQQPAQQPQA